MKTKRKWKSRRIRCWVITRECLAKGQHYAFVLCLLPSRFRPKRVADVVLGLHHALGSDFFGKHYFAASATKRRQQSLFARYDRVDVNDNPSTNAVLAEDVIVEAGDSEFDQIITWTDPDVYHFEPGSKPVKEFAGKKRKHVVRFSSGCNAASDLMTWGLACPSDLPLKNSFSDLNPSVQTGAD